MATSRRAPLILPLSYFYITLPSCTQSCTFPLRPALCLHRPPPPSPPSSILCTPSLLPPSSLSPPPSSLPPPTHSLTVYDVIPLLVSSSNVLAEGTVPKAEQGKVLFKMGYFCQWLEIVANFYAAATSRSALRGETGKV